MTTSHKLAVGETVSIAGHRYPGVVLATAGWDGPCGKLPIRSHPKARGIAVALLMPDERCVPYVTYRTEIKPLAAPSPLPAKVSLTISRKVARILLEDEARSRDEKLPDLLARLRQGPDELLHDIIDRMIEGRCQRIMDELKEEGAC